ncbi:hypothetical protein ACNH6C_13865 [Bdellovibrio bacteriovorus]|uniref:hypothetical protein n=1 Tax=Bdellovibrio bacteriovorus TaxID=959 RepID=UPI003A810B39
MKFILLFVATLTLSACMTTKEHVVNGQKMYEVTCNGLARSYIDCQTAASKKCAETDQHFAPVSSDGTQAYVGGANGFTPITNRTLLYKCVDREPQAGVGQ